MVQKLPLPEFATPSKIKATLFKQVLPKTWNTLKDTDFQTACQEASEEEKELLQHILEQKTVLAWFWGNVKNDQRELEFLALQAGGR